jgi:hypothetical protein
MNTDVLNSREIPRHTASEGERGEESNQRKMKKEKNHEQDKGADTSPAAIHQNPELISYLLVLPRSLATIIMCTPLKAWFFISVCRRRNVASCIYFRETDCNCFSYKASISARTIRNGNRRLFILLPPLRTPRTSRVILTNTPA